MGLVLCVKETNEVLFEAYDEIAKETGNEGCFTLKFDKYEGYVYIETFKTSKYVKISVPNYYMNISDTVTLLEALQKRFNFRDTQEIKWI